MPPGLRLLAPHLTAQIRARGSAGDFVVVVHRQDSTDLARAWAQAADAAGMTSAR